MQGGLWEEVEVEGKIIEWFKAKDGRHVYIILSNVEINAWENART